MLSILPGDIHRDYKKRKTNVFCYKFKHCLQISIKFGRQLQQLMLNSVYKLPTSPGVCTHTTFNFVTHTLSFVTLQGTTL